MGGRLSMVGTPIGNLADLSPRAVETLAAADCVLAEDTRVTGKLLKAFGIDTRLERCDENVIATRAPALVERLQAGEHIAFTSDAGMPCISDPGAVLVDAVLTANETQDARITLEVVPGPDAVATALAASGFSEKRFFFGGFMPRKAGERRELLDALSPLHATLVFYESPNRVSSTLLDVAGAFPTRRICIARELTKLHEEVLRGSAAELLATLASRGAARGEIVLLIEAPRRDETELVDPGEIEAFARGLIGENLPASEVSRRCAKRYHVAKRVVYDAMCGTGQGKDVPTEVARAIIAEAAHGPMEDADR